MVFLKGIFINGSSKSYNMNHFRRRLEKVCKEAKHDRFNYYQKDLIGHGGQGLVYLEPYKYNGKEIVQKVNQITEFPLIDLTKDSQGLLPLNTVTYKEENGFPILMLDNKYQCLVSGNDLYSLQTAVAEYVNMRVLKGESFFEQITDEYYYDGNEWSYRDREFFLLDGKLCVRTIMEKVSGKLLCDIFNDLNDKEKVKVGYDLAKAIAILGNGYKIVHKDIKPENVMLEDCTHKTYLIDFGNSTRLQGEYKNRELEEDIVDLLERDLKEYVSGTTGYLAPEIYLREQANIASDRWALGCLLFNIFTGRQLFINDIEPVRFKDDSRVRDGLFKETNLNDDLIGAIDSLIKKNPDERLLMPLIDACENVLMYGRSCLRKDNFIVGRDFEGVSLTKDPTITYNYLAYR